MHFGHYIGFICLWLLFCVCSIIYATKMKRSRVYLTCQYQRQYGLPQFIIYNTKHNICMYDKKKQTAGMSCSSTGNNFFCIVYRERTRISEMRHCRNNNEIAKSDILLSKRYSLLFISTMRIVVLPEMIDTKLVCFLFFLMIMHSVRG